MERNGRTIPAFAQFNRLRVRTACGLDRTHQDRYGGRAVPIEKRRQRVDAEAERLAGLRASFVRVPGEEGLGHYGIAMQDPEGNDFDIN